MADSIQERAARGAALLDQQFPRWAETIDLDAFDIGSFTCCVASQVGRHFEVKAAYMAHAVQFPDYGGVARVIGELYADTGYIDKYDTEVAVGFMPDGDDEIPALQAAWEAEIETRLRATSPS